MATYRQPTAGNHARRHVLAYGFRATPLSGTYHAKWLSVRRRLSQTSPACPNAVATTNRWRQVNCLGFAHPPGRSHVVFLSPTACFAFFFCLPRLPSSFFFRSALPVLQFLSSLSAMPHLSTCPPVCLSSATIKVGSSNVNSVFTH